MTRRRDWADAGLVGLTVFLATALLGAAAFAFSAAAPPPARELGVAAPAAAAAPTAGVAHVPSPVEPPAARPTAPGAGAGRSVASGHSAPAPAPPPPAAALPGTAGGHSDMHGDDHGDMHGDADGHMHGGRDIPLDGWTVAPDTYATPDHPAYDWYARKGINSADDPRASVRHLYAWDEQFGCNVDHPYMRWLMETTTAVVEANYATLKDALIGGFVPLNVAIPNDFGYPDTYWHWWNQLHTRPRWQDRVVSGAEPKNERDWVVQPEELQHLLLVPSYWKDPVTGAFEAVVGDEVTNEQPRGELIDGWVTAGVMFAQEYPDPLSFYDGCDPMHNHGFGDNPHMHLWLYHHLHPLAMNPPHLCNADGSPKEAPYGALDSLRDHTTWTCIHGDEHDHASTAETRQGQSASVRGAGSEPAPARSGRAPSRPLQSGLVDMLRRLL